MKKITIGAIVTGVGVVALASIFMYFKKTVEDDLNFDDIRFDDWYHESLWNNTPLYQ